MTTVPEQPSRLSWRAQRSFRHAAFRYLFGIAMAASALGLRLLLSPWTGKGAPFVLFFGALLVTSLVAGLGPGLLVLLVSLPLATVAFAIPAGASITQAGFQALLYGIDGLIILELTHLTQQARRRLQHANRDLGEAAARLQDSETRTRQIVELAPDAYFQADLQGRFVDVNQAACTLLGYERNELLGKGILDVIPPEDAGRLDATRAELLIPGVVHVGEWTQVRKDGTHVPVEVSSNVLPGGRWQAFVRDITKRKRIEDERQVFTSLLENSPDFIGIADPTGKPVYVNPAGRRMVGLPLDLPAEQTRISEYYPPDQRAFAEDVILREMLEHGRWSGETYFRHWQTEAPIPVSDEHFMIRDPSGARILGIGTVTRDISQARRTAREREELLARERAARNEAEAINQQLRESEAKFSGIISISADAIVSIDQDQKITVFNAGAESIFGYSREEIIGAPLDLLIPEPLRESHRKTVAAFAAGHVIARRMGERLAVIKGRRKNGEEFPAEASISNLKVGDTNLLTAVVRDVTERDRIEREQRMLAEVGVALAASLDYEQTLATVAQIAAKDFADWCFVEVMEGSDVPRRLKVASASAGNARIADQLEHFHLDRKRPYLTKAVVDSREPLLISNLTPQDLEAVAQSSEHLQLLRAMAPKSMISVPLASRQELLGTLTFVSSTSSRKYGPANLRLALTIAERASLAIENARLYRAALHATGMRDQVLSVVAHDLRNPLNTILLHASALQRPKAHPERRKQQHREMIERAAGRMNRLIQDLLDVAVMEAGHLKVDKVLLSPGEIVGEAVDMQRALATASSIELVMEAAADVPQIFADRDRLLQVFENLIGNAFKFTPAGGQVTVGVARGESGALFWVADTGRGMPPEDLERIFDRFWQASARAGRLGAGLGLPITKGIVEAHGGRIWAESTPGQGSRFIFAIPEAPSHDARSLDAMH